MYGLIQHPKKSELYKLAQIAVLKDWDIAPADKLELLEILSGDKLTAEIVEKHEAKGAE